MGHRGGLIRALAAEHVVVQGHNWAEKGANLLHLPSPHLAHHLQAVVKLLQNGALLILVHLRDGLSRASSQAA